MDVDGRAISMKSGKAPPYAGSMPRSSEELTQWHALRTMEPVLEPALPIIDAHHHVFGTVSDRQHYRITDLEQDLCGGHAVVATVYIEAYGTAWHASGPEHLRPVGETERIVESLAQLGPLCRQQCDVAAGIVAHADLTCGGGVREVLEAHIHAGQGRLRGVRHIAARDDGLVGRFIKELPRKGLMGEPSFRAGFSQLAALGLSYDAWLYHHQLDELIELADQFPNTQIVLDHLGGLIGVGEFAMARSEALVEWTSKLTQLARRPNVVIKIGGMGMPVFGFGFEHENKPAGSSQLARAWMPLFEVCLHAFGSRRCMFESNFPVDRQACGYTELWNAFKIMTASMTSDERHDLFCGTAARTYKLNIPPKLSAQAK